MGFFSRKTIGGKIYELSNMALSVLTRPLQTILSPSKAIGATATSGAGELVARGAINVLGTMAIGKAVQMGGVIAGAKTALGVGAVSTGVGIVMSSKKARETLGGLSGLDVGQETGKAIEGGTTTGKTGSTIGGAILGTAGLGIVGAGLGYAGWKIWSYWNGKPSAVVSPDGQVMSASLAPTNIKEELGIEQTEPLTPQTENVPVGVPISKTPSTSPKRARRRTKRAQPQVRVSQKVVQIVSQRQTKNIKRSNAIRNYGYS